MPATSVAGAFLAGGAGCAYAAAARRTERAVRNMPPILTDLFRRVCVYATMKVMRTVLSLCLIAGGLWGQAKTPRLEFEVASIKAAPPNADPTMQAGVQVDGSQVHLRRMSMKDFVRIAYQVKYYQVLGPEWMAGERY